MRAQQTNEEMMFHGAAQCESVKQARLTKLIPVNRKDLKIISD